MTEYVSINDIQPGMILKAVSASGSRYRKVYKVVASEYARGILYSIWSIPVHFNKRVGEWIEECAMVSNGPERIGHMCVKTDSGWSDVKIRIQV